MYRYTEYPGSFYVHDTLTQHRWVLEGTILECDDASWDFSFNLNVKSMFHVCKAVLPQVVPAHTCRFASAYEACSLVVSSCLVYR